MVVTDSRGRGIQQYIDSCQTSTSINVISHPGAGFELAVLRSINQIRIIKPHIIIVALGICDLTWKNKTTKLISLRHSTVTENVNHVVKAMKNVHDLLNDEGNFKISFATLTGLDLTDSNNPARRSMSEAQYKEYITLNKVIHGSQYILDGAILAINKRVTQFNRVNGIGTVWLAGLVHAYIKGSYHHYYRRLTDGCHLDDKTKHAWAKQIVKSINRIKN